MNTSNLNIKNSLALLNQIGQNAVIGIDGEYIPIVTPYFKFIEPPLDI
ncbi:MAG: hypothetical protein U9N10_01915 [Bacillota bacterium]|nr:hypothetical protein [Bacillota bacterium]